MGIIAMLLSLIVLTFLYRRMIARDVPEAIGRKQALVPVLLGFVSLPLALIFNKQRLPLQRLTILQTKSPISAISFLLQVLI